MPGVLLGSVQFVDREVPDRIRFPTKQMLAIHRQLGGARVIDAMGPDPEPISWSGLFFGPSAGTRAREVQQICDSGQEVSLSWGSFSYQVMVAKFEGDYKHEWEVRYSISCEVIGSGSSGASFTLDQSVSQDFSSALSVVDSVVSTPAVSGSSSINPV